MYDDDYPTCAATHATFRLYHADLDPDAITQRLGLEPTRVQRRGEPLPHGGRIAPVGGWFLGTRDVVGSRDLRRHVDWLLACLAPRAEALGALRAAGYKADVICYWRSAEGHGGPVLSPPHLRALAELGLEIGFDVYGV